MCDVFISYSSKDTKSREEICGKLEAAGIKCWYAPRDIRPGEEWADAITNALQRCKVFLLIFTENANDSSQVLREVGLAADFKKTIIPFKFGTEEPGGSMRYYLSALHWLDSSSMGMEQALDEVVKLCRNAISGKEDPLPSTPPIPAQSVPKNQVRKTVLIILILNLLLLPLVFFLGNKQKGGNVTPDLTETIPTNIQEPQQYTGAEMDGIPDSIQLNGKEYVFSPENDSAGAENYLYTIIDNRVIMNTYADNGEKEITIPEIIDGLPVTMIGASCFEANEIITRVTLPDTIITIGDRAFANCVNLKDINWTDNIKEIGYSALEGTALIEADLPADIETVSDGLFLGCTSLRRVVLHDKVTFIDIAAFTECSALETVEIHSEKISIDNYAFDSGTDVTLVGVPGSRTETYARLKELKFAPLTPDQGQ